MTGDFKKSLQLNPFPKNDYERLSRGSNPKYGGKYSFERDPEEIKEYKRYFVERTVFRWLDDAMIRFYDIVEVKEKSIENYKKRMKFDKSMWDKLNRKKERVKYYKQKIKIIKHLKKNWEKYPYEFLETIPYVLLETEFFWEIR